MAKSINLKRKSSADMSITWPVYEYHRNSILDQINSEEVEKNPAKVDMVDQLSSSIAIEQFDFDVVKDHDKPGNTIGL